MIWKHGDIMGTYMCAARTNYFTVTDENIYNQLFSKLVTEIGDIEDLTRVIDGRKFHCFGAYCSLSYKDNDDLYEIEVFIEELQRILPKNEVFIYEEVGHEKLKFLNAFAFIATSKNIIYKDLENEMEKAGCSLIGSTAFTQPMF